MDIKKKFGEQTAKDVATAKQNGCVVQLIELGSAEFIYRSLNRMEWKSIQKQALKNAQGDDGQLDAVKMAENKDAGEESVVVRGLIYPKVSDPGDLSGYPAGYISQLADRITELSGYGETTAEPVLL